MWEAACNVGGRHAADSVLIFIRNSDKSIGRMAASYRSFLQFGIFQ